MSSKIKNIIIVTGGLGFIAKHFITDLLSNPENFVYNIDSVTYAADREINKYFSNFSNYCFLKNSIVTIEDLPNCDILFNFAAESHVDNSISSGSNFLKTNISGVHNLLEKIKAKQLYDRPLFVQISTDEVYGDIKDGNFDEAHYLVPSNPYSATKAAAEMLVRAWGRTYNIDYFIIRMTNIYGPGQHVEKLIPRTCMELTRNKKMPLHGDGSCIRTWLHVLDAIDGIKIVVDKGVKNEIYNIGGIEEFSNFEVVKQISNLYNVPIEDAYQNVPDRPGHDVRYSLDTTKIKNLGWNPKRKFREEIINIVNSFNIETFLKK